MLIDSLRNFLVLMALVLTQALVFSHIHLFGCATILLYVYFVVMFTRNYPKWAILLWSFVMGLFIDMFSNTPGMAAASLTVVGCVQPYLLELFIPREATENLEPTMKELGVSKYLVYVSVLVFLHCLLFFTLEFFSFFNWQQWALNIAGSTVITLVFLVALEAIRK